MKKFGTFGGVFTPSILTILGVIMYLRLGWVVGNSGTLVIVIGIILMAHIVSVSTGLSISSIATDKKIKSGGIYYILSRSLGFPIGGAIGLTLYLATSLSISLYLIGFAESVLIVVQDWLHIEEITINHLRIAGTIALLLIVTIAYVSTSFAIKIQYLILAAIAFSLISVFFGTSEGKGFDFSNVDLENAPSFAIIFGVFFPAVTGFTAGVALSGDLKDPKKSIPVGTMLAIFAGLIIYTGLAIFIYFSIPGAELQNNYNVLVEFSWIPQLVIAGIWGATLSSALGGILGGPRILQSMSLDKITPRLFGKGVGAGNEPRNALLFTFVLAEAGILIGELNVIAGIVAMFYMAAYMVINLSCFLEKWASPDFRPTFKINIFIPLIGVVAIFLLMVQLNLVATLASIVIMGAIFVILTRRQLELSSGDVWSSVWSSVVKLGLKNLGQKPKNLRNWEPNILLFSGGTETRPHLISFSKAISGRGGMVSNFDLIETPTAKTLFPKYEQAQIQDDLKDDTIFHRKQECNNLFKGIETIASTYGFSGIEPNTTLMGWARNTKDPIWFANMNQKLNDLDYNILYLDYDKAKGFGSYSKIDIWWNNSNNVGDLTLQIAKRILSSDDWSNAVIRILYLNDSYQKNIIENLIRNQLASLRIDFPFQVINNEIDKKSFYEIIKKYSYDADLIMIEIPTMKPGEEASFVRETNNFLGVMGTTLLIRASEGFTAKTQDHLELEKVYNEPHIKLELKSKQSEELKLSNNDTLDKEILQIDHEISKINTTTSNKIITALADVYTSLYTLFKGKIEHDKTISPVSLLELKERLIKDLIDNNRLNMVSDVINEAVKNHVDLVRNIIHKTPKVINRIYDEKELGFNEDTSQKVNRIKQKLKRKKIEKIRLLKSASSYFNNEYLENLSQQILFVGVSGNAINNSFINWISNHSESGLFDLDALGEELENIYKKLSYHFLISLNSTSRQLCNDILVAANSIGKTNIFQKSARKLRRRKRKAAIKSIDNYAQKWLNNHQLLINQLLLHVQLSVLHLKTNESLKKATDNIENILLNKTLKSIEKYNKGLNDISIEELGDYEKEFYQNSNQISLDESLGIIQSEMETNIMNISDTIEVVSYDELNSFESTQEGILPTPLNARKITRGLLENQIIAKIKELYQQIINEGRTENNKLENAVELLKLTLLNLNDNKKNSLEVLRMTKKQFDESANRIHEIKQEQDSEIIEILASLKYLLDAETIVKRADDFDVVFKKTSRKKLSHFIINQAEHLISRLDNYILVILDKVAKTDSQYRAKSKQNPHTQFADFSEKVSLAKRTAEELPFYYYQLFTGKHAPPSELLKNRLAELSEVKKAVDRIEEGKNGAILFTGDHLSGKTYLMKNAVNFYFPKNVIAISAPVEGVDKGTEILDNAFSMATGFQGDSIAIIKQLKKKSTLVFEDLELWWTRSPSGSACLEQIVHLIKLFRNKHLFVLDCNILFYQHIRQYINIDEELLATINTSALSVSEISEIIMNRHHSGGMKFIWQNKVEDNLNTRQLNNLFRKITSFTDGNIGMAFYMWLGNIVEIQKAEMQFADFENHHLPKITNAEWENMLMQILMHKHLTFRRLKQVYHTETEDYVNSNLQSLIRAGLVIRTASNGYCISPYIITYLVKYFQNKLEHDTT